MSTYTEIHIHAVFSVQDRIPLLAKAWRCNLYKYIISIIQKHGHKVLSIGGTDDHVHILLGLRANQSLMSIMQEVKRDSSEWINQNNLVAGNFHWQKGYGAFSHSKSQIRNVAKYIENQETHHAKQSFEEEYKKILDDWGVHYNKKHTI